MKIKIFGAVVLAVVLWTGSASGQTNLNFNNTSGNVEGAVRLSWNSISNEIYELDYADTLLDTNTGNIAWNTLYSDYPSHGTNTFCLDTGNYFADSTVVHPSQAKTRFYRVLLTGTNTTATTPMISISSPTNGATVSGGLTITVTGSTGQPFLTTKLYVDGQEMNQANSSTNWTDISGLTNYVLDTYFINTCE